MFKDMEVLSRYFLLYTSFSVELIIDNIQHYIYIYIYVCVAFCFISEQIKSSCKGAMQREIMKSKKKRNENNW